jgi:hypothetical protein
VVEAEVLVLLVQVPPGRLHIQLGVMAEMEQLLHIQDHQ